MDIASILALIVVFVGIPLNIFIAVKMWGLSRIRPDLRALRDRAIASICITVLIIVFGLIFLNNDRLEPPLAIGTTKIITRAVTLIVALIPSLYWIRLYRKQ